MAAEAPVSFSTSGVQLEGRLALPPGATHGAVICHPHPQYGGTMENNVVVAVAAALQYAGIATLRFNFRGVGTSEGEFSGGPGEVEDARAAMSFLRARLDSAPIAVAGYSFGAMVALRVGHAASEDAACLVAIAPPLAMADADFLASCAKPKLFVVGEHDEYCPTRKVDRLWAILLEPKTLVRVAAADHFFAGREPEAANAVRAFVAAV